MSYRLFLFDLDGTLVDTSPGILEALRRMEQEVGVEPLPQKTLEKFIGPPLEWSMETYYGLEPRTAKVWAEIYRRIYTEENCIAKSRLYPYIRESLALIREKGGKCAVTSLKMDRMVAATLEVYDLAPEFDARWWAAARSVPPRRIPSGRRCGCWTGREPQMWCSSATAGTTVRVPWKPGWPLYR